MPKKSLQQLQNDIDRLEQIHQSLQNARIQWESRTAHPVAATVLEQVEAQLQINADLLVIARELLAQAEAL